jgi:transcriptional regulator with AAA-type ATPase domain/tetratricopeptide (TPR) repeat protein
VNVLAEIIGDSPGIRRLRKQLEQILTRAATARRPPPVLLRGETGTGKGLVARIMHRAGTRASAPFVDVNCAAIPDTLLEAELFGYERGAFTDARQAKPGLFQLAHRGTLFLDEIGMLSPGLQAKLLKVLEDGVVRRLGGTRAEPIDVWIISATNEDLAEAQRARRFREDLYHRLAVLSLALPPLRERGADVLVLADRFLARASADYGLPPKTFARDARAALEAYGWPGNVRELGNVIERVALLVDEPVVTAAMLALPATTTADDRPGAAPAAAMSSRDQMRAHLLQVLTETGGNISQTAVRLGVARNTVLARMARFGLNASTAASPARSRGVGGSRRDAPATAPTDVSPPLVATSRPVWEPRRVALLRVDVGVDASGGSADTSRALDEMIGKVRTFGGELVELGRGALVAAFGLEAVEDAPVRAALAALAILKAGERAHRDSAGPRVKIVVHVAQVLVSQHQGTATIDLESKRAAWTTIDALVGLDEHDAIVVSEAAAPFLERRFELVSVGAVGTSSLPFRRFTRRERTGFGLGGRPLSPFVGREGEVRLVTDRLASTERGQGQVIGILGEPGVGKSRFVYELTRLDAMHDWRVLGCSGVSYGSTTPFLPTGDLLRRYFVIEDADGHDAIRERVTETIMSRHEELTSYLTPLLSLLDIPVDDPSWKNLDPPQQRQRIQDAVKRLLLRESRIQPVLLIVEDLHWIDGETQALLDELVESLPTARLLLLITYRHEYQHGWGSKTYYSQLRLDALPPERAVELLNALLGDDPGLGPLTRLLVERGNPFFIEESVRALVETGALVGERGAYRLTRPIETIEIPATVQAILAARIERLDANDKQLLQTAAVIGNDVPVVLLRAVADAGEDDVQQGLSRLRAAEFLYETRLSPDAEYVFKHALTQEVAYGTLLEDRRTELHARIVGAIEGRYRDRLTEHVERLAYHAERGELWDKAVTYLHQAGLKDAARAANREAVSHFERALEALAHRPESRETSERAIDLRLDLKTSLFPLGAFERIIECLREAETLARTLDDQRRLGQVYVHLCHVLGIAGRPAEAIAFGRNARALAESLGDVPLEVMASLDLGAVCLWIGDYRRAEEFLLNVVRLLEGEASQERFGLTGFPAVIGRAYLALIFADQGEFEQGIAHGQEGIRLAEAVDHPYSLATVCWCLAYLHVSRGDLRHADALLERGLALARECDLTYFSAGNTGTLGYAYALSGRTAEGLRLLEQAVTAFETMGNRAAQSLFLGYLGETHVLAGRLDDAFECAGRALARARERGQRGDEARALRLLGDVTARRDFPHEAEGHYRDALTIAEELGMRPLAAHCHLGLSKLYRRAGTREQAQEHLTTATTMYREMDMRFWLEHAETEPTPMARE